MRNKLIILFIPVVLLLTFSLVLIINSFKTKKYNSYYTNVGDSFITLNSNDYRLIEKEKYYTFLVGGTVEGYEEVNGKEVIVLTNLKYYALDEEYDNKMEFGNTYINYLTINGVSTKVLEIEKYRSSYSTYLSMWFNKIKIRSYDVINYIYLPYEDKIYVENSNIFVDEGTTLYASFSSGLGLESKSTNEIKSATGILNETVISRYIDLEKYNEITFSKPIM